MSCRWEKFFFEMGRSWARVDGPCNFFITLGYVAAVVGVPFQAAVAGVDAVPPVPEEGMVAHYKRSCGITLRSQEFKAALQRCLDKCRESKERRSWKDSMSELVKKRREAPEEKEKKGGGRGPPSKTPRFVSSKPCHEFAEKGSCKRGRGCAFSHLPGEWDEEEIRGLRESKREICKRVQQELDKEGKWV